MSSLLHKSVVTATLVALVGCASSTDPQSGGSTTSTIRTTLPRALTAAEQKVVGASNEFSFSLFRQLNASQKDSNVFSSPLGASMALGMMLNGAAGSTYDQMRTGLQLGATTDQEVNGSFRSLVSLITDIDPVADFGIGSSLWYRSDVPVNQGFIDTGVNAFGAQVSPLDFASASSAQTINTWVNGATTGRIPTIVDGVDASQSMVLANAIYFRGLLRDRFDPYLTSAGVFYSTNGEQDAKMMYRVGTMRYFATHDLEAVDLPFGNGAYTMTVVLPRAGKTIDATIASFQGGGWADTYRQLRDVGMNLFMPKFRISWDYSLGSDLVAVGMHDAFTRNGADFTRMSPRGRELYVGTMKQRTLIDFNEDGTLPAATTPLVPTPYGYVPLVMYVDRSFVFVIHERLSGTIVFIGKVVHV